MIIISIHTFRMQKPLVKGKSSEPSHFLTFLFFLLFFSLNQTELLWWQKQCDTIFNLKSYSKIIKEFLNVTGWVNLNVICREREREIQSACKRKCKQPNFESESGQLTPARMLKTEKMKEKKNCKKNIVSENHLCAGVWYGNVSVDSIM